jgi:predicted nucleotidyltransferase component of viral defense system
MEKYYVDTVRLLLATLPEVFAFPKFALKGGTALNLFLHDMPRLSVDIDVVFTDHLKPRIEALKEISAGLTATQQRLKSRGIESELTTAAQGEETKLFVKQNRLAVKVEVNHVFRGTFLPVTTKQLNKSARDLFTTEVSAPVLASAEIYGSKIVAALDRQHPRDFFDIEQMFAETGLTSAVVDCFTCYLAGHNRPMHEVLFSRDHDLRMVFENEFQGMTRDPVSLEQLQQVRNRLRKELPESLTAAHRRFLLSILECEPEWDLIQFAHLKDMPALRWKIQNLQKLKSSNSKKFQQQAAALREKLEGE